MRYQRGVKACDPYHSLPKNGPQHAPHSGARRALHCQTMLPLRGSSNADTCRSLSLAVSALQTFKEEEVAGGKGMHTSGVQNLTLGLACVQRRACGGPASLEVGRGACPSVLALEIRLLACPCPMVNPPWGPNHVSRRYALIRL